MVGHLGVPSLYFLYGQTDIEAPEGKVARRSHRGCPVGIRIGIICGKGSLQDA